MLLFLQCRKNCATPNPTLLPPVSIFLPFQNTPSDPMFSDSCPPACFASSFPSGLFSAEVEFETKQFSFNFHTAQTAWFHLDYHLGTSLNSDYFRSMKSKANWKLSGRFESQFKTNTFTALQSTGVLCFTPFGAEHVDFENNTKDIHSSWWKL